MLSLVHSPVIIFGNDDKGLKQFYRHFLTNCYPKPMNSHLLRKETMFNFSGPSQNGGINLKNDEKKL